MRVDTIDLEFLGLPQVIACYVLTLGDRVLLVDPGPASCLGKLDMGLAALGYTRESISGVLLTHIHFDHAGAAWAFAAAGARVHVHPLGERHLIDPSRLWDSAARIYGADNMIQLWGEMQSIPADKVQVWAHQDSLDLDVSISIVAHHTPGHAKHHIAWQVGDALFLGDVGGIQIGHGPIEAPCPPPDIDVVAWLESLTLLGEIEGIQEAYRTHFGRVSASSFTEALDATGRALGAWLKIAEEVLLLPLEERDQAFMAKIEHLRSYFPDWASAYALANPAHMSLGGLQRYIELHREKAQG